MRRIGAIFGVLLTMTVAVELVLVPLQIISNSNDQARAACQGLLAIRSGIIRQAADQANGLVDFALASALRRHDAKAVARTRAARTPYVQLQVRRARDHNPKPSCSRIVAGKPPIKRGSK